MAIAYKYTGNKLGHDKTQRIILEGSSDNPERFVDLGGEIELTESEVKKLRVRHELQKVGEESKEPDGSDKGKSGVKS